MDGDTPVGDGGPAAQPLCGGRSADQQAQAELRALGGAHGLLRVPASLGDAHDVRGQTGAFGVGEPLVQMGSCQVFGKKL
jgi:hypothetical protein